MKRNMRRATIGAMSTALAAALLYRLSIAAASGVPTTAPLAYAGFLEENGTPVDGMRSIVVNVWNDASATATANNVCTTLSPTTPVSAGRFRIPLDPSCTAGIHANADIWTEVQVGGISLGRTKVAAMPYALEADRASNAAGALQQQIVPSGMVAMFASACPPGWMEFTALRGRFPRGQAAGNPAALGMGGSDDAIVVAHTHTLSGNVAAAADHTHVVAGTTASDGAHAHNYSGTTAGVGDHAHGLNINNFLGGANQGTWNFDWIQHGVVGANAGYPGNLGAGVQNFMSVQNAGAHSHTYSGATDTQGAHTHTLSTTSDLGGGHTHSVNGLATSVAGASGAGANLPSYQEVIFCQKL